MNGLKSKSEGTLSRQRSQLLEKRQDAAEAELVAKNNIEDEHGMRLDGIPHAPNPRAGEERIRAIADHFYIERSTAHTRKSRAVGRLAKALFG